VVVVRDTAKMFHTTCPTHGDWFERFSKGMHERMQPQPEPHYGLLLVRLADQAGPPSQYLPLEEEVHTQGSACNEEGYLCYYQHADHSQGRGFSLPSWTSCC
jgi:hypothetical protein